MRAIRRIAQCGPWPVYGSDHAAIRARLAACCARTHSAQAGAGMRTHCAVPGKAGSRSAYLAAMAGGTKRPCAPPRQLSDESRTHKRSPMPPGALSRHTPRTPRKWCGPAKARTPAFGAVRLMSIAGCRPSPARSPRSTSQPVRVESLSPRATCAVLASLPRTRRHVDGSHRRRAGGAEQPQQRVKGGPWSAFEAETEQSVDNQVEPAGERQIKSKKRMPPGPTAHVQSIATQPPAAPAGQRRRLDLGDRQKRYAQAVQLRHQAVVQRLVGAARVTYAYGRVAKVVQVASSNEAVAAVVARPCGARRVSPMQLHAPRRTRLQAPGRA